MMSLPVIIRSISDDGTIEDHLLISMQYTDDYGVPHEVDSEELWLLSRHGYFVYEADAVSYLKSKGDDKACDLIKQDYAALRADFKYRMENGIPPFLGTNLEEIK